MSEGERKIRLYLQNSAGNANVVTDHTILCFIGMVETGEVTADEIKRIGGEYIANRINEMCISEGLEVRV